MKRIVSICCGILLLALCATAAQATNLTYTPTDYTPHIFLSGFTGTNVTGEADVLAPVWSRETKNFFLYGQGRYGHEKPSWAHNSWTGSLGAGYRQIVDLFGYKSILGAYTLAEYTRTPDAHSVWLVSPGIESLGSTYDFRVNGYFPVSDHDWKNEGFASDYGNYDHVSFSGHTMFDAKFIFHEEAGPGGDVEAGRRLFKCHNVLVKGYLDGYYFHMQHNPSIWGGGARITIQPSTAVEFSLNDVYDKYVKNVFMAGIQVSLYDLFKHGNTPVDEHNLQRRLFDPLERNFGQIASGSNTRLSGIAPGTSEGDASVDPEVEVADADGHSFVEYNNVWFFQGNGLGATNGVTLDDGTFEHPLTSGEFDQATVDGIKTISVDDNLGTAYLFFTGGPYTSYTPPPILANNGFGTPIDIPTDMNLWGRMGNGAWKGFKEPATGSSRPLFYGALTLAGDNSLQSIQLHADSAVFGDDLVGIELKNNAAVSFDKVSVDVTSDQNDAGAGATGINMDEGSSLNLTDSDITASATATSSGSGDDVNVYTTGIEATNDNNTVNFNGGTNSITANATAVTDSTTTPEINGNLFTSSSSIGLDTDGATINFNSGTNSITANSDATTNGTVSDRSFSEAFGTGIASFSSTVNFNGGVNNIVAQSTAKSTSSGGPAVILNNQSVGIDNEISSAGNSMINFVAGTNTITSTATGTVSSTDHEEDKAEAIGIKNQGSGVGRVATIKFTGGTNDINATASAPSTSSGIANGILDNGTSSGVAIIDFSNPTSNKINITATGDGVSNGILATESGGAAAKLQINGVDDTTLANYLTKAIFTRGVGGAGGFKIDWTAAGHGTLAW